MNSQRHIIVVDIYSHNQSNRIVLVLFSVFLSVGPHHHMEMHIITAVEQHYCKNKEHILYYITDGVVDIIITVYTICCPYIFVCGSCFCCALPSATSPPSPASAAHSTHTQPCHTQLLQTQPCQTHTHTHHTHWSGCEP